MKKFKFKLDTVLKVKLRIEAERKQQLQQTELARDAALRQLENRRAELEETIRQYEVNTRRKFDRILAHYYNQYTIWLGGKIKEARIQLDYCENEVAQARQRLLEAAKERKTLEKLKEKAYRQYKTAELREEIIFLDELGTERFVLKSRDGQGGL
jgi:flagellar FliJ protein